MKTGRFLLSAAMILVAAPAFAHGSAKVTSSYVVHPKSKQALQALADRFDMEGKLGNGFLVYIDADKAQELIQAEPTARLVQKDIRNEWETVKTNNPKLASKMYDFTRVERTLQTWEKDHPDFVKLEVYGKSSDGNNLMALKLAPTSRAEKPGIMITGATHGNEVMTVEVVMGIAEKLIGNYKTDQRVTAMINDHDIYFIPVVSPDSYIYQSREVDGVDPNRNYPWPENPNRNPVAPIKGIMNFVGTHSIKASLDYHSAASVIMWPWAYTDERPDSQDLQVFTAVADKMSEANRYQTGQISDVMYIAKGSSADYYYWKHKTMAMAVELSSKYLYDKNFDEDSVVTENLESTYRFIESF